MVIVAAKIEEERYIDMYERVCRLKGLSRDQATVLLCVGYTASNDPGAVAIVANHHLKTIPTMEEQVAWVEYVRQALFKACLICSFPRSMNATYALMESLNADIKAQLRVEPISQPSEPSVADKWRTRGNDFLQRVYGDKTEKLQTTIHGTNPDLWIYVEDTYGNIASDTTFMTEIDTELSAIVNLYSMSAEPQLADHLKGARNVGASEQQVQSALDIGRLLKECS
ncbi:hypothetical protein BJV82DRAFT_656267 [Fennellomyces sp. T-0311]|nr:hypothetical protein BJV82DRAFT_656267 [Fennellomyces sp. T-0311]